MDEMLLSGSEMEILDWMWKEDKEYSYKDIAVQFGENSEKGWKKQTLSTFLTRMEQKGAISVRYEGEKRFERKRYFTVALTKQQYESKRARHLLNSYFNGSLNQFMVALNGGEKITRDEADALKKFLEDM